MYGGTWLDVDVAGLEKDKTGGNNMAFLGWGYLIFLSPIFFVFLFFCIFVVCVVCIVLL